MFKISSSIGLAILFFAALNQNVVADIVLSVSSSGSNIVDLGAPGVGKTIDFFIGQDANSNHLLVAAVAHFKLGAGIVGTPPGIVSATGGTGTAGYFGAGNLAVSEITLDGSPDAFLINQDFTSGVQTLRKSSDVPARERWFTLNLNTTNLATGVYSIVLENSTTAFGDLGGNRFTANNNLSFTVTAIPEPMSLSMLAAIGAMGCLRRRRI